MAIETSPLAESHEARIAAGCLPPWTVGNLPPAPARGWRTWIKLIGPGVLLAGASIGSGEWLFGPAVSAQYGATLLWLAGLSIGFQVFCNLEMMRYAVYSGESIIVGYLRTWPGPKFWMVWYAVLDIAAIWPFNASNAAVPLAAAMLGHLPGQGSVSIAGMVMPEWQLVKVLGFVIFLLCFVPLIFGGTIYKMLERVMAFKLVVVLGFLCVTAVLMVSPTNFWEVVTGFVRVGSVPLQANTIVAGRNFIVSQPEGNGQLTIKGTMENGAPLITEYLVDFTADGEPRVRKLTSRDKLPPALVPQFDELKSKAVAMAQPGRFFVQDDIASPASTAATLTVSGRIERSEAWQADEFVVERAGQPASRYAQLAEVPEPYRANFAELVKNQGLLIVGLGSYYRQHGALPPLDWAMLAAFAAIAGAGGMTNSLFSNYARDAGWGMGARVGTIPSAIGGRNIQLSHVGEVFPLDQENMPRWRGWLRHVYRDQLAVWMLASAVGMAIPCMLSLEFIRHAPVSGDRVAAMMAGGMAERYPQFGQFLWFVTLLCGFLVLAPGQILAGDNISRRWTDIIWTSNSRIRKLPGHKVRWVYYSILATYCAWGLVTLSLFDPLQIAKISGVLMNVALGWSAIHAVYVNRMLMPRALQSPWIMQLGAILCGVFFLGISTIVIMSL